MNLSGDPGPLGGALSVVLPAFGVESVLGPCLDSILAQPVVGQVVVVIDGDCAGSEAVARGYAAWDARVQVTVNPENIGLGASRNRGLEEARCEYVAFVDSDDLLVDGAHEVIVAQLEESGSDFATSLADEFSDSAARSRYWTLTNPVFSNPLRATNLHEHPELVDDHTAWTKVFRRSFLRRANIRWPEETSCEDVVGSLTSYVRARAVDVVPVVSYLYRRRQGSIAGTLREARRLREWMEQTTTAIGLVEEYGEQALQSLLLKVLNRELPERLSRVESADSPQEYEPVLSGLSLLLAKASLATLRRIRPAVLRRIVLALERTGHSVAEPAREIYASFGFGSEGQRVGPQRLAMCEPPCAYEDESSVSVVMYCHNAEATVEESVRSVLRQEVPGLELIVVEDGSVDASAQLLERLVDSDERIRVLRTAGLGAAAGLNHGASLANGEYLAFIVARDLLAAQALKPMVQALERSGDDVLCADWQFFTPTQTVRRSGALAVKEPMAHASWLWEGSGLAGQPPWAKLFRRSHWERTELEIRAVQGEAFLPLPVGVEGFATITLWPFAAYHQRGWCSEPETLSAEFWGIQAQTVRLLARSTHWGSHRALQSVLSLAKQTLVEAGRAKSFDPELRAQLDSWWQAVPQWLKRRQSPTVVAALECDPESARQLLEADEQGSTVEVALAYARALTANPRARAGALRGVGQLILTPLLTDCSEWSLADLKQLCVLAGKMDGVCELGAMVVPGTRSERVWNLLVAGAMPELVCELLGQAGVPVIGRLELTSGGRVRMDVRCVEGGKISRLELTEAKVAGVRSPVPVAEGHTLLLPAAGMAWPPPGVYTPSVLCDHPDGLVRHRVRMAQHKTWFGIATLWRARADALMRLPEGVERLRRALAWRLRRGERLTRSHPSQGDR